MVLLSPDHPVESEPFPGVVAVVVAKPNYVLHDPPINMAFHAPTTRARRTDTTMELAADAYVVGHDESLPYPGKRSFGMNSLITEATKLRGNRRVACWLLPDSTNHSLARVTQLQFKVVPTKSCSILLHASRV